MSIPRWSTLALLALFSTSTSRAGQSSAEVQGKLDRVQAATSQAQQQLGDLRRNQERCRAELAAADQAFNQRRTEQTGKQWRRAKDALDAATARRAEAERLIQSSPAEIEQLRSALAAAQADEVAIAERAKPSWRSTEGYQKALWGMSRRELKKLFRKASGEQAILSVEEPVAGFPATTSFYFARDRLTGVVVRFHSVGKTRSEREAFEALQAALTEKYGRPDDLERSALNGDPTETWSTEKTTIVLALNSLSVLDRLTLSYSSQELEFLRAELDEREKDDL